MTKTKIYLKRRKDLIIENRKLEEENNRIKRRMRAISRELYGLDNVLIQENINDWE